jgi:NDP-sugar pyrophosphorylase family protein
MKAMLLCAGRSTRLGALGTDLPKPMLRLAGRPVLEWTIRRLADAGIAEVVINLHHAPTVIPAFFGDGSGWGLRITYLEEPELLGTAGAVRNARDILGGDSSFMVVYGDTPLDWDPAPFIADHDARGAVASLVVAEVVDPSQLGVVVFDAQGRVTAFYEKPGHRPELGRWVNAGACIFGPPVFDHIPGTGRPDLGADVLPSLVAAGLPVYVYRRPRPLVVVDTPEQYRATLGTWQPPDRLEPCTGRPG